MRCPFILSHQGCVHLASLSSVHRNTGHLGAAVVFGFLHVCAVVLEVTGHMMCAGLRPGPRARSLGGVGGVPLQGRRPFPPTVCSFVSAQTCEHTCALPL